ncbi:MAG: acetolactate synthase small subunit [Rhodospirillaceae bacterium]|nr:acetolactate synthase small subunit [Rhodospirillaceae bacterium]MDG1887247.1 acetolactate synthase small subunit [Alphaproteobacteria bacterium]|tara:strand:+ start:370 stop:894 length:525 start_codon:yes stop_codon:yes gene_type:complete
MSESLEQRHTIALLVDNEPGVLARVIGLFAGRGYNIESLTVSEVDTVKGYSRITIVTSGTEMVIQQIKALLSRIVPVHEVHDLSIEGPHLERELALIKINNTGEQRIEAMRIADMFRARAIDSTLTSFVFEVTGSPRKVDAFINLMSAIGNTEVCRGGVVAIARGSKIELGAPS